MIEVLTAWKAVRSEAIVTGDEVLGKAWQKRCAWKALRHRTCIITFPQAYCLPGRSLLWRTTGDFVPGYRRFAP